MTTLSELPKDPRSHWLVLEPSETCLGELTTVWQKAQEFFRSALPEGCYSRFNIQYRHTESGIPAGPCISAYYPGYGSISFRIGTQAFWSKDEARAHYQKLLEQKQMDIAYQTKRLNEQSCALSAKIHEVKNDL